MFLSISLRFPSLLLISLSFLLFSLVHACSKQSDVQITFYGSPDNDPPGGAIAHDCGRGFVAGGTGTFSDPLTFATADGEFDVCEVIYIPYLEKYARMEDFCAQCDQDWKQGGKWHIDIWTGNPNVNGGQDQISCEDALTPSGSQTVVRQPDGNLSVDSSDLYQAGANPSCRNEHDTYPGNDADQFCSTSVSRVMPKGHREHRAQAAVQC